MFAVPRKVGLYDTTPILVSDEEPSRLAEALGEERFFMSSLTFFQDCRPVTRYERLKNKIARFLESYGFWAFAGWFEPRRYYTHRWKFSQRKKKTRSAWFRV